MKLKFEDRIVSYLADELSVEEKNAFISEVENSSDLKRELESYKSIWRLTNQLDYSQDDSDISWEMFQRKIEAPFNLLGLDWLKIAASITLLAAVSFGIWFFGSTDINLTTERAVLSKQLADKTEIILDFNSTVIVDKNFDSANRAVSLAGHGYFDIAHSTEKFTINCGLGQVVVHGTSFNLLSSDEMLVLELIDGSVSFTNEENEVLLAPNQRLVVTPSDYTVDSFEKASVWEKDIICTNTPLIYIFEQLSLVYNVDYQLPNSILKDKYTVTLPKDDIENCIHILNKLSGQKFVLIDKRIVLQ